MAMRLELFFEKHGSGGVVMEEWTQWQKVSSHKKPTDIWISHEKPFRIYIILLCYDKWFNIGGFYRENRGGD